MSVSQAWTPPPMKELFISLSALPSPPQPGMLGSGPGYGYGNGMANQGGSPATWIHFNPLGPLDTAWIPCRTMPFLLFLVVTVCHMSSYVICTFLFVFDVALLVDNTFLRDDVVFDNDEDGDEG